MHLPWTVYVICYAACAIGTPHGASGSRRRKAAHDPDRTRAPHRTPRQETGQTYDPVEVVCQYSGHGGAGDGQRTSVHCASAHSPGSRGSAQSNSGWPNCHPTHSKKGCHERTASQKQRTYRLMAKPTAVRQGMRLEEGRTPEVRMGTTRRSRRTR